MQPTQSLYRNLHDPKDPNDIDTSTPKSTTTEEPTSEDVKKASTVTKPSKPQQGPDEDSNLPENTNKTVVNTLSSKYSDKPKMSSQDRSTQTDFEHPIPKARPVLPFTSEFPADIQSDDTTLVTTNDLEHQVSPVLLEVFSERPPTYENLVRYAQPTVNPVFSDNVPLVGPSVPVVAPEEPVIEPTVPIVEPTLPVAAPSAPVVEPAEPIVYPTEPVAKPTEPVVKPTDPVVKLTEPIGEPTEPIF